MLIQQCPNSWSPSMYRRRAREYDDVFDIITSYALSAKLSLMAEGPVVTNERQNFWIQCSVDLVPLCDHIPQIFIEIETDLRDSL